MTRPPRRAPSRRRAARPRRRRPRPARRRRARRAAPRGVAAATPCAATTACCVWPASTSASSPSATARPLFVVDEADFRSRCRDHAEAFGDPTLVHYAAKAFLCAEVARWVADEGLGLDVCSGASSRRRCGPASRPSGSRCTATTSRSPSSPRRSTPASGGSCSTRSPRSPGSTTSPAVGTSPPTVMVRVTVGVEAHTHEFIATAHEDQKFGFSLAGGRRRRGGAARAEVRRACAWSGCTATSARRSSTPRGFELAAQRVVGLLAEIRAEHGQHGVEPPSTLDLGGGLGIAYTTADEPPLGVAAGRASCARSCDRECERAGLPSRASPSSPAGRSPGPARSRSTRWAPSRTSSSAGQPGGATSASTAG